MVEDMDVSNPLDYEGYEDKLAAAREKTGLKEAVTVGRCKVFGDDIVLGVCDSRFMMASMGHVVGEKITKAIERATQLRLPVFLFCCSGGARNRPGSGRCAICPSRTPLSLTSSAICACGTTT